MCRARASILPVQLPEASHLSHPDLTRTERGRPLTGRDFFFSFPLTPLFLFSTSEVNRMSATFTFHSGKQLFIRPYRGFTNSYTNQAHLQQLK